MMKREVGKKIQKRITYSHPLCWHQDTLPCCYHTQPQPPHPTAVQTLTRDVTKSGERHTPTSPRSPHVRAASSPSPVVQAHHPSLWARGRRGEMQGFEKDKGVAALCLQLSEALPEPLNSHNPAALHLYQAQQKGASHFWLHLLHHRGFLEAVNL